MRHKSGRQLPIPSWQQFMAENCGWLVGHPRPRVSTSRDSQLDPDPDFEYLFIYCLSSFNTRSWIPIFDFFWEFNNLGIVVDEELRETSNILVQRT